MKLRMFGPALVLATALAGSAMAATIDRPECIAPAKPGGGFDLTCRVAQVGLKDEFGKPVAVTFMPGGIGAVAINLFNTTRSEDPNAIVAFSSGSLLNMATGKFGQWTEKDVKFLATAGTDYGAVIVKEDSPFKTLDDLMKAAAEDTSSLVMGAGGSVGSQDWMKAAVLLNSRDLDAKKMRYVAFDGGGEAIAGLLGGSIQVYTGDVGEMVPYLDAGTMRILAVMSPERLDAPFADIPTAKEQGYDAEWTIVRGYYMGKNVPQDAYDAWVAAFEKAYATDEWNAQVEEKGLLPLKMTGDEMNQDMATRVDRMRTIARKAGLIQ